MYMSYVLDFLSKQNVDQDGNPLGKYIADLCIQRTRVYDHCFSKPR